MQKQLAIAQKFAQWFLIAIILLLPWQARYMALPGELAGVPWEYGTVSFYALDILIVGFAFFALVAITLQSKKFPFTLQNVLALFLCVVALLSLTFSSNHINGVFWWVKLCEGVVLFFLVHHLRMSPTKFSVAVVVSGVIQSAIALIQFFTQQVVGNKWLGMAAQHPWDIGVQVVQTDTGRVLRSYGMLPHPNMLAGFLVVALIIAVTLYITREHWVERIAAAIGIALLSAGLWTTFSRQAFIALAVALTILIIYTFIRKRSFPRSITLAVLYTLLPLLAFTAIYPELVTTRVAPQSAHRLEEQSIDERTSYMNDAATLLRENWVTGVGVGNYTAAVYNNDDDSNQLREGWYYQPVHNIYLLIFTELGIFGLLGFLFFLLSLVYQLRVQTEWQLAWGTSVLSLLIIGLFDHYLWSLHFGILLFWITCAFFLSTQRKDTAE